ncbi:MAG: family 20 glycosylhydrolase [Phocaeicola sp.]
MKKLITTACLTASMGLITSCGVPTEMERSYNEGINIIPQPLELQQQTGHFLLTSNLSFSASTPEAETVAAFFAAKLKTSTGISIPIQSQSKANTISLKIVPSVGNNPEAYRLEVTPDSVTIEAAAAQGLFYGMQSFMQLLPAEVESPTLVKNITWSAPCVTINDAPRFGYRGFMLDPCRHFIPVENVKKQIDVLSLFKINTFHWHLTDDQGWRIEIKRYPKLTEIGSKRIEGEGYEYGGFYTQEEIKEVVAYAAERFITVIPELEMPGHEMAAIAAYPELSCRGEVATPRILWGVEDIVMCPGKEDMFTFLEGVIEEMIPLFPSTYFHVGGDECPKKSWETCPACQARIKAEGLKKDKNHSAEEYLQSYVIRRMEKVLAAHGKKLIGWDEILEGGLSPQATVMSWRGIEGGIAAALQDHDVIMSPGVNGMYLDQFQGDPKIEPVSIGGYNLLSKVYDYNPVPDTLVGLGKDKYIIGVQFNNWSEYMYTTDIMEYRIYPRALAVAELGWTQLDRKNYADFERRIYNAYVRLDGHGINYHIPQPEQPRGSCNFVAFVDSVAMEFTTTRPETMVYTLDGSEPTAASSRYELPIKLTESTTVKIRTLLPSGKMSPTRTIAVEKQALAPAVQVEGVKPGLNMVRTEGVFFKASELTNVTQWSNKTIESLEDLHRQEKFTEDMRGIKQYAAVATGYINIPEDGVYYFSTNNDEFWIDGKLLISNEGEVKRFSRHDSSVALAKGLHEIKMIFLCHTIGGWPSLWVWNWDGVINKMRKADQEFAPILPEQLFHTPL